MPASRRHAPAVQDARGRVIWRGAQAARLPHHSAHETRRRSRGENALVAEALATGNGLAIQEYPRLLDEEFRLYFKVARLFAKIIGNPRLMRELTRVGMQSHSLMEWALRIMANLLRPDELGPAEAAYKAIAVLVRLVPDSVAATKG